MASTRDPMENVPMCQGSSTRILEDNRLQGSSAADGTHPNGVAHLEEDKLEPIAVIGLALRFPQDATSPEAFWQMLMDGRSAMTEVPKDRFNIDAFYQSDLKMTNVVRKCTGLAAIL